VSKLDKLGGVGVIKQVLEICRGPYYSPPVLYLDVLIEHNEELEAEINPLRELKEMVDRLQIHCCWRTAHPGHLREFAEIEKPRLDELFSKARECATRSGHK
jgi:hypothetical protein